LGALGKAGTKNKFAYFDLADDSNMVDVEKTANAKE